MARIVQRYINNKFTSYDVNILIKETVLPFDCYIKRYGDYVIIIQAGTYISEALLVKMSNNKEIYLLEEDAEKIRQYHIDHEIIDLLANRFDVLGTYEEQLSIMYTTMSNFMHIIFDNADEKLPLDTLRLSLAELANGLNIDADMIPMLLKIIPHEYTTHHHSTNVAFFAIAFANAIHLPQEEILDVGLAGLLHDIGKIRIDSDLLLKPSRLKEDEYETIKHHSEYGYMILKDNGVENQKILNGVRFHHEKLDGSGYPKGLRDRLIPKYAKIIGMCDAFDALTTNRTFRKSYSSYEALLAMKEEMSLQFDTAYINTFIQLLGKN